MYDPNENDRCAKLKTIGVIMLLLVKNRKREIIRHNSHQMYGANEDDPSTKLETSKEELEAGEAVVDAQFGNLLKTAFIIGN